MKGIEHASLALVILPRGNGIKLEYGQGLSVMTYLSALVT